MSTTAAPKTDTVVRRPSRGFSLVELLVAMAIGLVVSLAVTGMLIRSEADKRSSSTVDDLDQTGAYVLYRLDRILRSAGSGFAQSRNTVFGCTLDVKKNDGTQVLPLPAKIATADTAFGNVDAASLPIRLAPVIVAKNLASVPGQVRGDVLMVMSGTAGHAESGRSVSPGSVTADGLLLSNTLGYATDDLLLLSDPTQPAGCMLQQVGTHAPGAVGQALPLSGTYHVATGTLVKLADFGVSATALQLGNASATTPNMPQFQLLGVGGNATLSAFDLLQYGGAPPEAPLADGVAELHALYGVDTGTGMKWVDPGASGYDPATLMNSSDALRQVVAIRIGLILRSPLRERDAIQALPDTTLFAALSPPDPSLRYTMDAASVDPNVRYRTVELTVPLRNVMLAP